MMASWPSVQHWRRYIASRDGTVGPSSGLGPPTCISSDYRKRKQNGMASFGSAIGAMTSAARNCAILCLIHARRKVWTWTLGAGAIQTMAWARNGVVWGRSGAGGEGLGGRCVIIKG